MTLPRAWRNAQNVRGCRPRTVTDAPPVIPDSKAGQLDALLHDSGILPLIDKELEGRPGPDGLPVRTVLVGLLLALHYGHGANLADAFRILADHCGPPPAPGSVFPTSPAPTRTPVSRSPAVSTAPSTG